MILFRVYYHPTRVIETVKKKVFVRRGDQQIELKTDEERRQLRIDKGEVQFEQESSGLLYPADFDIGLVDQFVSNVRKMRGADGTTSDLKILTSLRLGRREGERFVPNLACAILFAKDPVSVVPGCKIHFLRYDGTEEKHGHEFNETANTPPIEGPLPKQLDEINRILNEKIRRFQGFGDDGKFHTTPEYPEAAWKEAIVNACVHRSYNYRNRKIFVKMIDWRSKAPARFLLASHQRRSTKFSIRATHSSWKRCDTSVTSVRLVKESREFVMKCSGSVCQALNFRSQW